MTTYSRETTRPFAGSDAVRAGDLTWDRLAGPDFTRLHPDTYVGADADLTDPHLRALALCCWSGDSGVVGGPLAALASGVDCPWEDAEIVLDRRSRPPAEGVTVRTDRLAREERTSIRGARLTTPARTAFDLARRAPLIEAVAAVDALAHAWRLVPDDLAALAARHPRARGVLQVRTVCARMDPRAESLPETRLRLGLIDRGVPPGVPQFEVRLPSGRRKRLDLAWPAQRFALEYDGPGHRTKTGQNRDAFDRGRLGDLGWRILPVTGAMLLDSGEFDELAARVIHRLG